MTPTGIWNHESAGSGSTAAIARYSSAENSGSSSGSNAATISSNDFLTLLVTEMQNQDPTATTDPNEYINQLVNVNSLEQLISINQTLSTAVGTSSGAAGAPATRESVASPTHASHEGLSSIAETAQGHAGAGADLAHVPGNLSIPKGNVSAQRVAQSLGGA